MATDKVAYWLDLADEDFGVAEDLYKAKRWLYELIDATKQMTQWIKDRL
jgi:hypothetical protein